MKHLTYQTLRAILKSYRNSSSFCEPLSAASIARYMRGYCDDSALTFASKRTFTRRGYKLINCNIDGRYTDKSYTYHFFFTMRIDDANYLLSIKMYRLSFFEAKFGYSIFVSRCGM